MWIGSYQKIRILFPAIIYTCQTKGIVPKDLQSHFNN